MKGKFFVFEGVDGSGKSTQAKMFAEFLRLRGRDVVEVRDPGSTPVAEQIRAIIKDKTNGSISHKTQLLLFEAARAEMVDKIIRPSLEAGKIVICDRFTDSTLVYQSVMNKLYIGDLEMFNNYVTFGVEPDLTFYFISDYDTFKDRVLSRGEQDNVEVRITKTVYDRMSKEYQKLFEQNRNGVCISSETNRKSPGEIAARVRVWAEYMLGDSALDFEKLESVMSNGGYCPCATISTPETLCPCSEMMDSQKCKCNLFS
jgi:dTMP kinase